MGTHFILTTLSRGFLGGSGSKESACSEGGPGSMPRSGRSPGEQGMTTHSSILS